MKNKSIVKNYIYNLIFLFFKTLGPFLITPYVSRALGENGIGKYSFSYSIVTYFILFAALGFHNYAQRLVASHQGNRKQQSIDFWEIFFARLIPAILTLVVYFVLVLKNVYGEKYNTLLLLFSFEVIAVIFDITFFLQGNEEFGKTVSVGIVVKLASYLCMFIFVKNEQDLWKYVLIQSLSVILTNVIMWIYLPKYIERIDINELKVVRHLPATIILFLPTIATSIYTSLDKILIGLITKSDAQNGNYEYAEKIVKMALTFITALGSVLIPRNSKQFAEGDIKGLRENIYESTQFVFFLGVPFMFGCIVIADSFVPWFLGPNFPTAAKIMKILSPIIVIIGLSDLFGLQFLIPTNQDKKYTEAIVVGSISNLIFNILLIPKIGAFGAAIATVIAETFVTATMLYFIRNDISFIMVLKRSWKFWISGLIMFIICTLLSKYIIDKTIENIIIVFIGCFVYMLMLLLLKDAFLYKVINKILKEMKKFINHSA